MGFIYNLTSPLKKLRRVFSLSSFRKSDEARRDLRKKEMTTIRRFSCNDLLRFTSVNLDHLTETVLSVFLIPNIWFCLIIALFYYGDLIDFCFMKQFNMSFYMTYLARWPDYFHVAEGPGNRVMGYSKESFLFFSSFWFLFVSVCLGMWNLWRLCWLLVLNLDDKV